MEGSFIRWQGRAIEQLGAVNNAFTALALGILGLMGSWVSSGEASSGAAALAEECTLWLAGASVVCGAALAWNRLVSFRMTARIARKRETEDSDGLPKLRRCIEVRDKVTWGLLRAQLGFFSLALASLVIALAIR